MVRKPSIESSIPGFKRVKSGRTVNYVSEEGVRLSRRQAEYVREGKKSLAQAALTSFKGKANPFPYEKRTGNSYRFKSLFDLHDAVKSGVLDDGRNMIIVAHGKGKILYPGEEDSLYQWRAPTGLVAKSSYSLTKYWERVIDKLGDDFVGDPHEFDVIFLDPK
jgi:hypothetical protein